MNLIFDPTKPSWLCPYTHETVCLDQWEGKENSPNNKDDNAPPPPTELHALFVSQVFLMENL